MARPLELVNQKTCHGLINLTKKYQNHSCFSEIDESYPFPFGE